MKRALAVAACFSLQACSMSYPATAKFEDGTYLEGVAIGSLTEGKMSVKSDSGLSCSGDYDQWSMERNLKVDFKCSDGRSGVLVMDRTPDLMSGSGSGILSDGSKGSAAFGDLAKTITRGP